MKDTDLIIFQDQIDKQRNELVEFLREHPKEYSSLSEPEKELIRNTQVKCPQCGSLYDFYNKLQGKIQLFCKPSCAYQNRSSKKWKCAVCGNRFAGDWNLHKHIDRKHPEISKEQYIHTHARLTNQTLLPFCSLCGNKKQLNFKITGYYNQCKCINAETKMKTRDIEIENSCDPDEIKHLKRSKSSCKAVVTRMRNAALTQKPDDDASNIYKTSRNSTSANPSTRAKSNNIIKINKTINLKEDALFFDGIYCGFNNIYDVYDKMSSLYRNEQHTDAYQVGNELEDLLLSSGWKIDVMKNQTFYAYTHVLIKSSNAQPQLKCYLKKLDIEYDTWLDKLKCQIQYDPIKVSNIIQENRKRPLSHPLDSAI